MPSCATPSTTTTGGRPLPRARAAAGSLALAALLAGGCDRLLDRQIEQNLSRADASLLTSPDMTVVLCGTGSPLPDAERASACTAVIAGGQVVLVDAGPGSWEVLDLANVPTGALGAVLLTHFHSDHIGDLGEAITQSWIGGRTAALDVYGPPGTTKVVDGFQQAYASDVEARVAHHGEAAMPAAGGRAVGHDLAVPAGPDGSAIVFDQNGLRVTAFRVDHRPVEPALGYRFDYGGRSVVVSGDTVKSPSVVRHAEGADLLIHEALNGDMVRRAAAIAERTGRPRLAKLATDIPDYHTSPVEVFEVARDAKVDHLVLTHLVPAPNNAIARRMFLAGTDGVFAGEVTLGEDGMRFTLPPKS